jgi:hypothetical protein
MGGAGSTGAGGGLPNQVPPDYKGTPFGGGAQTIPGKIEIERYDLGGLDVAFHDNVAGGPFNKCGFMRGDAVELHCTGEAGPADLNVAGCGAEPAGSIYLGYIAAGEWYKYTVDVLEAGHYVISGHEGVAGNNVQVRFTFTADTKTGNVLLPSTDKCNHEAYHVWGEQTALAEIDLVPGHYVLTIDIVSAGMNLDWFAFTKM